MQILNTQLCYEIIDPYWTKTDLGDISIGGLHTGRIAHYFVLADSNMGAWLSGAHGNKPIPCAAVRKGTVR